jgi:N-acetyl-anhydromuramyl-L-alanine amidase AmpD
MLFQILEAHDKRKKREKDFVGIIIHHTAIGNETEMSDSAWARLSTNITNYLARRDDRYASAHFTISRSGIITRLVDPDTHEAFHAGKSQYWHPIKRQVVDDWNRYSIGIEIVGDGNRVKYSEEQYKALIELVKYLTDRYKSIHPLAIVGHENICYPTGRKVDPGVAFDWRRFFKGIYS